MSKGRRKLKNAVVDTGAQVRLAIPFFILLILSGGVIMLLHWQVVHDISELNNGITQDFAMITKLNQVSVNVLMISLVGLAVLSIACLVLWMIYSHRIFGPLVPIRRQVENLRNGNFSEQVTLRKYDEFKDLADNLNGLADSLKNGTLSHPAETRLN